MKIKFLHIILFWVLFAFFMTGVMLLVHPITNRPVSIYAEFIWEAGFSIAWILGTPAALWLATRFTVRDSRGVKNAVILFVSGLIIAVLLCVVHGIVIHFFHPDAGAFSSNTLLTSLFYNIDKMLLVYIGLVIMQHAMEYYHRFQEKVLTASQLETQLSQAQMLALKMQLQPHFLFNTLNAIVTLVRKDPDLAEEMVVRLSDFLRITLDASGKQLISLKEELQFIKAYLAIEEVRFGGRLTYREEVPAGLFDAEVPMLLLQPLVENAIRHGFSRFEDAAELQIGALLGEGSLSITVKDDASPNGSVSGITEGIGLTNIRSRLAALYGSRASLVIGQNGSKGFSVTVTIPYSAVNV
jgi:sensor histidine kinase YesM